MKRNKFLFNLLDLLLLLLIFTPGAAQDNVSSNSAIYISGSSDSTRSLFGGTITNSGYGGIVLKFSGFNNQFAFMTGGRGAITINNRYTIII